MNLPILLATASTLTFGSLAVYYSMRNDRVNKKLADKDKALHEQDDFTHMTVHELRAPLTAIKDAAKLLHTNRETLASSDTERLLSMIHDQSEKLLFQVGTILDAAKIENGRFQINTTPGDFNKTVRDAVEVFKPQAETKNVSLTLHEDTSLPLFSFDQGYMTEVITNLISNSLKFTPNGKQITVTVSDKEGKAILTVEDTGMGIPQDKQEQLFKKYSQLHSGSNPNTGSGLGLFIVKGIVEAHQGTISLVSSLETGTRITVTIPELMPLHSKNSSSETKAVS